MIRQTTDICPADKKNFTRYARLRRTVPSQSFIVASIMSKKLAENLDRLVLNVKFGSGAFMKTRKDAKQLAKAMTEVGTSIGGKILTALPPRPELWRTAYPSWENPDT